MGNVPANAPPATNDPLGASQRSAESNSERPLFQGHGQAMSNNSSLHDREAIKEAFIKRFEESTLLDDKQPLRNLEESLTECKLSSLNKTAESEPMTDDPDKSKCLITSDVLPKTSESLIKSDVLPKKSESSITSDKLDAPDSDSQCLESLTQQVLNEDINIITEAIFSCSLQPHETPLKTMVISNPNLYVKGVTLYLESLDDDLKAESSKPIVKPPLLSPDRAEQILVNGVAFFLRSRSLLALSWLADCYGRCSEGFINSSVPLLKAWRQLKQFVPPNSQDEKFNFEYLKELIIRHSALVLQCPEYFLEGNDANIELPSAVDVVMSFIQSYNSIVFCQFLAKVFDECSLNSLETLSGLLCGIIEQISTYLESRQMNEPKKHLVSVLQNLFTVKPFFELIPSHPSFYGDNKIALPDFSSSLFLPVPKQNAWHLQHFSLFGHILRPTSLDENMFMHSPSQSTRQRLFGNIYSRPLVSINQASASLSQELYDVIEAAAAAVTSLCRGSDADRRAKILSWFASVINSNGLRHQQRFQLQLDALSGIPGAEVFTLRSQGLSTDGFNLNVFWVLIKLLDPVKLQKVADLDPYFVLKEESAQLMRDYSKEGRYGDLSEVNKIVDSYKIRDEASLPPKFPTQLLWLAFAGLRNLFCPAIKSYETLLRKVDELQAGGGIQSSLSQGNQNEYEVVIGRLLCMQAVVHHPKFLSSWWNFCHLTLTFFGRIFLLFDASGNFNREIDAQIVNNNYKIASLLHQFTGDNSGPPQLLVLPLAILDDLMECITFLSSLPSDVDRRGGIIASAMTESVSSMDADLIASICLYIMRSNGLIKSPHARWSSGSQPLFPVYMHSKFHARLDVSKGVVQWLIPCVIFSFIDAQKAGYYGKIQQRLVYTRILEKALSTAHHAQRLKDFAISSQFKELFVRFLAMLVESMTWLLEEAMSSLAEIKKRESAQHSSSSPTPVPGTNIRDDRSNFTQPNAERANHNGEEEEEDSFDSRATEEGRNVSEMPFEQLEKLCQSLMDGGLRSLKVMCFVSKICGEFIVSSPLILTQVVTSLDCCLEHIAGARCLQLKVSNFDKYNFNPRQLLASTCEIYNHLRRFDAMDDRVLLTICSDSRYFKPAVFMKAHKIASREGILSSRELSDFGELTKLLQQKATEVEVEAQWLSEIWDSVPEEYKDPIMDELMTDPLELPTSGKIMDRKHIERHLTTEEFDPFNRMLLKKEDLIPRPELKNKIENFLREQKFKREEQKDPFDS